MICWLISEKDKAIAVKKREETEKYSDAGDGLFLEFFAAHYPQYAEITYVISPEEIFSLKDKELAEDEMNVIRERLDGYLVTNNTIYLKSETEQVFADKGLAFEVVETEGVSSIKGTVAHKGLVTGKVRKLLYKEQIPELQEGEILVAEMTAPDFMPAIKKAAAIVTNEGGITCHAAIVSRELKKPCVIGTKIATQVLKDGDLVEVDANAGMVRVMEATSTKGVGEGLSTTIIKQVAQNSLEKYLEYNSIPVVYFDASCEGYIDNPIFEKLSISTEILRAFVLDTKLQGWNDHTKKQVITETNLIHEIVDLNKQALAQSREMVSKLRITKDDHKILAASFEKLNQASTSLYNTYIFFTDEWFDTDEEGLLKELPDLRIELSEFVVSELWTAYDKVLATISDEYKLDRKLVNRLTKDEITELLSGTRRAEDLRELSDRPFAMVIENNKLHRLYGDDALLLKETLVEGFVAQLSPPIYKKHPAQGCFL